MTLCKFVPLPNLAAPNLLTNRPPIRLDQSPPILRLSVLASFQKRSTVALRTSWEAAPVDGVTSRHTVQAAPFTAPHWSPQERKTGAPLYRHPRVQKQPLEGRTIGAQPRADMSTQRKRTAPKGGPFTFLSVGGLRL